MGATACPAIQGVEVRATAPVPEIRAVQLRASSAAHRCQGARATPQSAHHLPDGAALSADLITTIGLDVPVLRLGETEGANARVVQGIADAIEVLKPHMQSDPTTPTGMSCLTEAAGPVVICHMIGARLPEPAALVCEDRTCLATLVFDDRIIAQLVWARASHDTIKDWHARLLEGQQQIEAWLLANNS